MSAKHRAFTLVELLVVIAIIGLLSAVALISINSSRIKARDAKRKADFHQVMQALEQYYQDNGRYPDTASGGVCASDWGCWAAGGDLATALSPYLAKMPQDPYYGNSAPCCSCGSWYVYVYQKNSDSQYCLAGNLEGSNDPDKKSCSTSCHGAWPNYYFLSR